MCNIKTIRFIQTHVRRTGGIHFPAIQVSLFITTIYFPLPENVTGSHTFYEQSILNTGL